MWRTTWLAIWILAAACSLPELPKLEPCRDVVPTSSVPVVDGTYCGRSMQNGFIPTDHPDDLITCVQRHTASVVPCGTSCRVSESPMVPDGCLPDPCAQTAGGLFCGSSMQLGFDRSQASPWVLYTCAGGVTMKARYCPYGCTPAPKGSEDDCDPPPAGALR